MNDQYLKEELEYFQIRAAETGTLRGSRSPWISQDPTWRENIQDAKFDQECFLGVVKKLHTSGYLEYLEKTDDRSGTRRCTTCRVILKFTEDRRCKGCG